MSGRAFGVATALLAALVAWPGWARPLRDPDLWWLLYAGEALRDGTFSAQNRLSFTAPEALWRLHEPVVAWVYASVGQDGVGWVRGLVLTALAAAMLGLASRSRSGWAAVLALAWAGPLVSVALSERAMAWGDALLAALMLLVWPGGASTRRLAVGAILVGFWANVHASFVIGVLVLALVRWPWALAAAGLSALSPFGRDGWALAFSYGLGRDSTAIVHAYIQEWTPLWPDSLAWTLRLVLLLAGLALALGQPGWRGRALVASLGMLALWHRRYCDVFAIAALPAVLAALSTRLPPRPIHSAQATLALAVAPVAIFSPPARPDPAIFPDAVRAAIEPGARAWTDIELGAWVATADAPVFWDARNDCYPAEVMRDGVRVALMQEGWAEVLRRWEVRQLLTREPRLASALAALGAETVVEAEGLTLMRLPKRAATDTLP